MSIKNFYTPEMKKPLRIMLKAVGIVFGTIILYKVGLGLFIKFQMGHFQPQAVVSTATVNYAEWQPTLKAVGSLRTTLGVNVTAQLAGMIKTIYFTPGSEVKAGDILVQQNSDTNVAQLHALEANAALALITYTRDKAQYKIKAVSKQQLETDEQNLKSLTAQVEEQTAVVAKLSIRAPFSGRLGISRVNPGQYLNPGDTIVTLQSLDPIYVDFYLPQQALAKLKIGQAIQLTSDTYPKKIFTGKITTINPIVETDSRNVEVEATLPNPNQLLTPGMYVNVEVYTSHPKQHLTVPQTAINFNSFGDIVYVVKQKNDVLTANQTFVTTGDTRGNQIIILKGLKKGDVIVTSGQLKLQNGSVIAINNTVTPDNSPSVNLPNEHGS
jgi:membrane fusion protein (multidrug efflux system)